MPRWRKRLTAAAVASLCLIGGPAAQAKAHRPAAKPDCAGHHPYAGWTEVDVPDFPQFTTGTWSRPILNFAADQGAPGRVFVTDGLSVLRSTDWGCTWKQVFQVPTPPVGVSYDTTSVPAIVAAGGNRVYLVTAVGLGSLGPLVLYASSDGGATFSKLSGPALPYYDPRPGSLVTSPQNPKRLYLIGIDPFYVERSDDAGATWTMQNGSLSASPGQTAGYVAVDPANADLLYLWGPGGLWRSTDGAASFKQITQSVAPLSNPNAVGVLHASGAPTVVVATATGLMGCNADCSLNGALPSPPKMQLTGVASSPNGQAAVSTTDPAQANSIRLFSYEARSGRFAEITPPLGPTTTLLPLQNGAGARAVFWTASPTNLYYRAY